MNHIRFLSTNHTVCDKPKMLGHDFVIVDYAEGKSCDTCLSLILHHNEKERQYDLLVELPRSAPRIESYADDHKSSDYFLYGLIVSSIVWVAVIVIFLMAF